MVLVTKTGTKELWMLREAQRIDGWQNVEVEKLLGKPIR